QALGWHALLLHSSAQFFEENALMRGVLIDEHESVGVFHEDIKLVQHADDLELLGGGSGGRNWLLSAAGVSDPHYNLIAIGRDHTWWDKADSAVAAVADCGS